ncbi:MAG TPA: hypothetical protein PKJ69_09165, partial [Spirochaetota bacterium]|nr:hypothetical protein [Spirochaetota bacterium]
AYIYSTSPDKQIIGYFFIEEIFQGHPSKLWEKFKKYAGIDETDFFSYFCGKKNGYAIKIGHLEIFEQPLDPNDIFDNFYPPQSFYYIDDDIFKNHVNKFKTMHNTPVVKP